MQTGCRVLLLLAVGIGPPRDDAVQRFFPATLLNGKDAHGQASVVDDGHRPALCHTCGNRAAAKRSAGGKADDGPNEIAEGHRDLGKKYKAPERGSRQPGISKPAARVKGVSGRADKPVAIPQVSESNGRTKPLARSPRE